MAAVFFLDTVNLEKKSTAVWSNVEGMQ